MARDRDDDRPRKKTRPAREEPEEVEELEELVEEVEERPKKRARPTPSRAAEPPRRKKPAEDDEEIVEEVEEERPRRKRAKARADDEDTLPQKRRGRKSEAGSGIGVGAWVGIGVVGLVLAVGGTFGALWLFSGSGSGKTAPAREIPKRYFAYVPAESVGLNYGSRSMTSASNLKGYPFKADDIVATSGGGEGTGRQHRGPKSNVVVRCWFLKSPIDLKGWVKDSPKGSPKAEWVAKSLAGKTVYASGNSVAFMPDATTFVVASESDVTKAENLAASLLKRKEGDFSAPDEQWQLLNLVSGYDDLSVTPDTDMMAFKSTNPRFTATGHRAIENAQETLYVFSYASEQEAKAARSAADAHQREAYKGRKTNNRKGLPVIPEDVIWSDGKHAFWLTYGRRS